MNDRHSKVGDFTGLAQAAVCALAFALVGETVVAAAPQDVDVVDVSTARMADLEKAFWVCDYAATIKGIVATPVAVCAAVTDELRDAKFDGDFDAFLAWWQQNKSDEFRKLRAAGR